MLYGEIPGLGKRVSRIGQGTMMLGRLELAKDFELLDAVYAAGVNLFDSAHGYGGGKCDVVFGQWVRARGLREEMVLLDKGCHPHGQQRRVTPEDLTADLNDCLERLGFDHVDIFALHRDDESVPVGPIVECFNEHLAAGRIRAMGGSNWTHRRIEEANEYAEAHGLVGLAVSSPHYSLAESIDDPWGGTSVTITGEANRDARQWYRATQLALVPWSALSGGFFSGRFRRDNLDTFTDSADKRCVRCYCGEDNFRRLDRAKQLAEEKGATLAQIALAYVVHGELNCFPLTAAWTPAEAADNGKGADTPLSPAEIAWLDLRSDQR